MSVQNRGKKRNRSKKAKKGIISLPKPNVSNDNNVDTNILLQPNKEAMQMMADIQKEKEISANLTLPKVNEISNDNKHSSIRKMKKNNEKQLVLLKAKAKKPEMVELSDVSAKYPDFHVALKCVRNSIPVPSHWNERKKYLVGKKGFLKGPFELPQHIKATGIMESRQPQIEETGIKNFQPTIIDYAVLHDAFFKDSIQPDLTSIGDLYYEGKEFEPKLVTKKPGHLSLTLKEAIGWNNPLHPPPWLFAMQKFGPPPSYPLLKIPGLNSPIPFGASWGFQVGGWGKAPTDFSGKPLYGDVFGESENIMDYQLNTTHWDDFEMDESQMVDIYRRENNYVEEEEQKEEELVTIELGMPMGISGGFTTNDFDSINIEIPEPSDNRVRTDSER
eukprot:TRINITY_DN1323_c1_g1_i1.p1 TRINITY_DN1323_c1_g1~~TRINITY_DN1323_c1_g1_i1.p1  ORF type:complete len:405 (-),score=136.11 TRINITY_DN1323_c1_g1_i1:114-1280(-)